MTENIWTEKNVGRSSLKRQLLANLPANCLLYRLCKHYVDLYNGENNDDMATNGELRFIQVLCRSAPPRLMWERMLAIGPPWP